MSFAPGARQMVANVIGFMAPGVSVTLRRDSTLSNAVTSAAVGTLAVVGLTAAGSAAISLDAANLRGRLVKGATFTIAGDVTVYTTTADADASGGALTAVPITPVLTAEAADNAVVTIVASGADQAYSAQEASYDRESASSTIDGVVRRLELAVPAGGRAPKEKDRVVSGFSSAERVVHVDAHEPESGYPVRWTVLLSTSPGVA